MSPPAETAAVTTAVVTGASTGIGRELAACFAADGWAVLLVANEPEVAGAAADLAARTGARVEALQTDLATARGVEATASAAQALGPPVGAVALNAGVGAHGRTDRIPLADDLRVVDLDVRSPVHLLKLLLPGMVERGRGRVLVTSSTAAHAPGPHHATYGAAKAFLHSWAEAVRHELRGTGVTVTSLQPGPTDTAFFDRADMRDTGIGAGPKDDPAVVARQAYDALLAGRDQVVAGSPANHLQKLAGRLLPDRLAAAVAAVVLRPGSARHVPALLRRR